MTHGCRVCGNCSDSRVYVAREMMYGFGDEFEYFMCSECGCLQISEVPADLSKYYPPHYYSFSSSEIPRQEWKMGLNRSRSRHLLGARSVTGAVLAALLGDPLPAWIRGLGIDVDSRILDVGCGSGHLLASLHRQGFSNLTGVDPYVPEDRSQSGVIRVFKRNLGHLQETFDLIMLHHSFEHVPDPLATLRAVRGRMRPGAAVVIRVPVVPSEAWDEYGTDWVQLDAPRHLHLHSLKSMEVAAGSTGLTIESVEFDSTTLQFLGSEQYRRGIPLEDPRSFKHGIAGSMFDPGDIEVFERRARELNADRRGDQACVVLRAQPRGVQVGAGVGHFARDNPSSGQSSWGTTACMCEGWTS